MINVQIIAIRLNFYIKIFQQKYRLTSSIQILKYSFLKENYRYDPVYYINGQGNYLYSNKDEEGASFGRPVCPYNVVRDCDMEKLIY